MKAYVVQNGEYKMKEVEEPSVEGNEVKVQLKTAGLNHRDLMIKQRVGTTETPYILGSDGAGVVVEAGVDCSRFAVGDEVIINPGLNWYEKSEAPPENFEIAGVPYPGTFAEKMVISEDFVEKKPSHFSWSEAGVFTLSGLTGYRALFTQGKIKESDTLFIPGAGGGVNSFIILLAKEIGAKVITTSRDKQKLKQAQEKLGYDVGILTEDNWVEKLGDETVDLVIESIGGKTFNRSLEVLKKGGRIVTYGSSTNDEITFDLRKFFYGQYRMTGSTMGSREELHELLSFVEQHDIKPVIDKQFAFSNIDKAFDYLGKQNQLGKVAVSF
ncbi:zinc-binding alcohol dehydrogenase/oxidoreductase [Gracilibacillus ureilyticus]|uniref:Zinc-binding alcohol dehydrogenase/oxidoreductase n=1 Tax=Gracilibacillus ureilyticus TaxID=531814 RepID=A0A1H9TMY8_9BACI|nr:zinc-binding dehydrogenase [Gracilibacillus ureilyticus]SER98329.1 zinc-binding alcohol dehydrogenase/oxidoreductase [Gracilibacillus ureilyticus]